MGTRRYGQAAIHGDDHDWGQEPAPFLEKKKRRVRTGCLTCRKRHLKCDEVFPSCTQCQKANRTCERSTGLQLIFDERRMEIAEIPKPQEGVEYSDFNGYRFWNLSLLVAHQYQGGWERFGYSKEQPPSKEQVLPEELSQECFETFEYFPIPTEIFLKENPPPGVSPIQALAISSTTSRRSHTLSRSIDPTSPVQGLVDNQQFPQTQKKIQDFERGQPFNPHWDSQDESNSDRLGRPLLGTTSSFQTRYQITNVKDLFLTRVFIDEVACWLDTLNSAKYFSNTLPYHARDSPILYNAILACGAGHLHYINPAEWKKETAMKFYDTALQQVQQGLVTTDSDFDRSLLAIASVILNACDLMFSPTIDRIKQLNRSTHLIQQCAWNATSEGVGGACFWIHRNMELLSCLKFKCPAQWDPDDWGLDLTLLSKPGAPDIVESELLWTKLIMYLVSKIVTLTSVPPGLEKKDNLSDLEIMMTNWKRNAPPTLQALGWLPAGQSLDATGKHSISSLFPQVYYPSYLSTLAQIYFHIGMVLLLSQNQQRSRDIRMHALIVCGIVKHVRQREILSFTIRPLIIASECLTDVGEQNEVIAIVDSIARTTGWKLSAVIDNLKKHWRWLGHELETAQYPQQSETSSSQILNTSISQPLTAPTNQHLLEPLHFTVSQSSLNQNEHRSTPMSHSGDSSVMRYSQSPFQATDIITRTVSVPDIHAQYKNSDSKPLQQFHGPSPAATVASDMSFHHQLLPLPSQGNPNQPHQPYHYPQGQPPGFDIHMQNTNFEPY